MFLEIEKMIELILFVFAVSGLTDIIVNQTFLDNWRNYLLATPFYSISICSKCTGFFAGLLCGFVLLSNAPLYILMCGFAGSFICGFSELFMNYLAARTIIEFDEK